MSYILIVDDEQIVARTMQRLLERKKAELRIEDIFTANDGSAGLKTFQKNPAECMLVISDYDMPIMDGEQLAGALRHKEHYQGPIAIISGGHTPERRERLAGLDVACLDKPFDSDKLREYAQLAVNEYRSRLISGQVS
ncbi:MAG TPA: response regulator [Candidatus Nanoarchaeia archaeon]|nr:response regulator [Candidatus Nanoarchaeia archaeon]